MAGDGLRMATAGEAVPFEIPGASGDFRIQILNEDRAKGVVTSIVHLPPGGRIPAHFHEAGAEMHYVLEGDLIEGGETLPAGAFLTHAKGVVHGPHESRGGARVLTVQTWQSEGGEFDFHPAEGAASAGGTRSSGGAPASGGASARAEQQPAATGTATQEEAAAERGTEKGYT